MLPVPPAPAPIPRIVTPTRTNSEPIRLLLPNYVRRRRGLKTGQVPGVRESESLSKSEQRWELLTGR